MNLEKLEELTIQWSEDRGIIKNSTPLTQLAKLVSEIGELSDNIAKGRNVEDDIGDCLVVLCNIAKMKGTNLTKCWSVAYNDIKDRKGYLNENGTFIKEGDVV
jgi:NTP pyrophosphatase (non-canonical NTP hydrolase)